MKKPTVIFHGNCLAAACRDAMTHIGRITDDFDLYWIRKASSVIDNEAIDPGFIDRASFCFQQVSSFQRDKADFDLLRTRLPKECRVIRFPPAMLSFLWPLVADDLRNMPTEYLREGPYPRYLCNRLIRDFRLDGRTSEWSVNKAAEINLSSVLDLDRLYLMAMASLAATDKESDLLIGDFVENNFRTTRLFTMPVHPSGMVIAELMGKMLDVMSVPHGHARDTLLATISAHRGPGAYDAPIHPQVISHFGLEWAENMTFRYYDEGHFTYDECMMRYAKFEHARDYYEGMYFKKCGQLDLAFPRLSKAASRMPNSPLGYVAAGQVALMLDKLDIAAELLREGLASFPDSGELNLLLAELALREGSPAAALEAATMAIRGGATPKNAWRLYAQASQEVHRSQEAEVAWCLHHEASCTPTPFPSPRIDNPIPPSLLS